jgi:hypothetical protein
VVVNQKVTGDSRIDVGIEDPQDFVSYASESVLSQLILGLTGLLGLGIKVHKRIAAHA